MKKQLLFTILCCLPILIFAQIIDDDFETGTILNWTNTDGSTTMLTNEMHLNTVNPNLGNHHILKTCDGSATVTGEMAFSYDFLTTADNGFFYGGQWGTTFELYVKNDNGFPLNLRVGIKGVNEAIVVTQTPLVVPANTDWTFYTIETNGDPITNNPYGNLATLSTGNYDPTVNPSQSFIAQTLNSVAEFRIIHNTTTSFNGEFVNGTLQVDNIFSFVPLSVAAKFLQAINVFPNPVVDKLFISFPQTTKGKLTLTTIDGRQLLSQDLNTDQLQLDVSHIKNKGVYFLKIETPKGTLTKKIIKA